MEMELFRDLHIVYGKDVVEGIYDAGFGHLAFWSDMMKARVKPLKARL